MVSKKELLELDIDVYNQAMDLQNKKDGDLIELRICEYCGRKYGICCICEEAEKRWREMVQEVKEVSEMNNKMEEQKTFEDHRNQIEEIEQTEDEYINSKIKEFNLMKRWINEEEFDEYFKTFIYNIYTTVYIKAIRYCNHSLKQIKV